MNDHLIFDTHAHYHDSRFSDGNSGLQPTDVLLDTLFSTEIGEIVDIGTDMETSRAAVSIAEQYPHMYAAVGMYPGSCPLSSDPEQIENTVGHFAHMLDHEKVVAIGEIGFDFHYDDVPRDIQAVWFERQMQLASEKNVPVIIHDREAHGAVMDVLSRYRQVHGILHSYSGSTEMAEQLIQMGYYISVSGVVTFRNARKLVEVVERIPLEYLLVETDAPYLTPHPHRGKVNHSGYLPYTVSRIAEIKGISYEEVCDVTRRNAYRIFGI